LDGLRALPEAIRTSRIRLSLTTEEWRKLRAMAAEEDRDVQEIIGQIVRQRLQREPARTAHGST
jgi:hypothetical protein